MIESLRIKNHQSHEETFLEFVPGINAIIGRSNKGKTAILRALLLLLNNKPLGFRYHSRFAPPKASTLIELRLSDAPIISLEKVSRGKGGATGIYRLGDEKFEGFDKAVPPEVIKVLNFSEINVQKQFDQPFLILAGSGEVAREINRVMKSEEADVWKSRATSRINSSNGKIESLKADLKKKKEELEQYKALDEIEKEVKVLETLEVGIAGITEDIKVIEYAVEKMRKNQREIRDLKMWLLDVEPLVNDLERHDKRLMEAENEIAVIHNYLNTCKQIEEQKAILRNEEIVEKVEELVDGIDLLDGKIDELGDCIEDIEWRSELISKAKQGLEEARKDYVQTLKAIGRCPFCLTKLTREKIRKILS